MTPWPCYGISLLLVSLTLSLSVTVSFDWMIRLVIIYNQLVFFRHSLPTDCLQAGDTAALD